MNKKTKITLGILLFILLIILGILTTYFVFKYKAWNQEKILKEEVTKISAKNLATDTFNVDIKTQGDYATLEREIKTYWQSYANAYQTILNVTKDERFVQILSIDNYKNDGKEFKKTKAYIKDTKKTLDDSFKTVLNLSSKEAIMAPIKKTKLDKKYITLYEDLMIDDNLLKDLNIAKNEMQKNYEKTINLLDSEEKVIDFLIKNKDKWQVKDKVIEFENETLLKQYNDLVLKITENV